MKKKKINDLLLRKTKIAHLKGGDITDPCLDHHSLGSIITGELTKCEICPDDAESRDCEVSRDCIVE